MRARKVKIMGQSNIYGQSQQEVALLLQRKIKFHFESTVYLRRAFPPNWDRQNDVK